MTQEDENAETDEGASDKSEEDKKKAWLAKQKAMKMNMMDLKAFKPPPAPGRKPEKGKAPAKGKGEPVPFLGGPGLPGMTGMPGVVADAKGFMPPPTAKKAKPTKKISEKVKKEYQEKLKPFKEEGWDVSEFEAVFETGTEDELWRKFTILESGVARMKKLKVRFENLNTSGFESVADSIKEMLNDPFRVKAVEERITELEEIVGEAEATRAEYQKDLDALKEKVNAELRS